MPASSLEMPKQSRMRVMSFDILSEPHSQKSFAAEATHLTELQIALAL
jgi:hypothetical protein